MVPYSLGVGFQKVSWVLCTCLPIFGVPAKGVYNPDSYNAAMASGFSEPSPRWGHFSAVIEGSLYVYGGRTKDFLKGKSSIASKVHLFNPCLESWQKRRPEGPPPPGIYHGASASAGHYAYFYGGTDGMQRHGSLHQLNTITSSWTPLSTENPMKKSGCSMVSHDDQLLLLGGHGFASVPAQPGAEFIEDARYTDGRGFTNELHTFCLKGGM